jgi:hypothetical protein
MSFAYNVELAAFPGVPFPVATCGAQNSMTNSWLAVDF